jgi:hypothetical protein
MADLVPRVDRRDAAVSIPPRRRGRGSVVRLLVLACRGCSRTRVGLVRVHLVGVRLAVLLIGVRLGLPVDVCVARRLGLHGFGVHGSSEVAAGGVLDGIDDGGRFESNVGVPMTAEDANKRSRVAEMNRNGCGSWLGDSCPVVRLSVLGEPEVAVTCWCWVQVARYPLQNGI